jgi:hypothetical protein
MTASELTFLLLLVLEGATVIINPPGPWETLVRCDLTQELVDELLVVRPPVEDTELLLLLIC